MRGVGVAQAKPACSHTIATRKCSQYNTIYACVFIQLSIVDPYILKWRITVRYIVPENILNFQYGRRRISDLKMASFVLNIHKLKISCLIYACVFIQLSIVDPHILKWRITVRYIVPENI